MPRTLRPRRSGGRRLFRGMTNTSRAVPLETVSEGTRLVPFAQEPRAAGRGGIFHIGSDITDSAALHRVAAAHNNPRVAIKSLRDEAVREVLGIPNKQQEITRLKALARLYSRGGCGVGWIERVVLRRLQESPWGVEAH